MTISPQSKILKKKSPKLFAQPRGPKAERTQEFTGNRKEIACRTEEAKARPKNVCSNSHSHDLTKDTPSPDGGMYLLPIAPRFCTRWTDFPFSGNLSRKRLRPPRHDAKLFLQNTEVPES